MRHAWLIQEWSPCVGRAAAAIPAEVLCPRANALTQRAVAEMRAAGFGVRAWGIKSEEVRAQGGGEGHACAKVVGTAGAAGGGGRSCRQGLARACTAHAWRAT